MLGETLRHEQDMQILPFVQKAADDLHYGVNPNELKNWNMEGVIIAMENPQVNNAFMELAKLYPSWTNAVAWGGLVAHRALRLEASSKGNPIPKMDLQRVEDFKSKNIQIARKLSRYFEDPKLDGGLIAVSEEEQERLISRLEREYPEITAFIWSTIRGDKKIDSDILELKETHPAYLGFSYIFLLMRDCQKIQKAN